MTEAPERSVHSFPPQDPAFEERVTKSFRMQTVMRTMGIDLVRVAPGMVELTMPFNKAFTQQHRCLALLCCIKPTLKVLKSNDLRKRLVTLGNHLRKRRLTLQLFQKDVVLRLGVNEWKYGNWENGHVEPAIRLYPKIIGFLGYYPFPEPKTLQERLLCYRRQNGVSRKRLARQIGLDEATLARWENGDGSAYSAVREKIERYLQNAN